MNPLVLPLTIFCALALAGTLLSAFVLLKLRSIGAEVGREAREQLRSCEAEIGLLRQRIEELSSRAADRPEEVVAASHAPIRAAFNLNKRAHALRMHRRGDAPGQISSTLEMPRQELDLLLKVHQIVMKNI